MHANWAKNTTATTGTGNLTISDVAGFPSINDVVGLNIPVTYHLLRDSDGAPLEAGIGYLSSPTTFVRSKIVNTYLAGTLSQISPSAVNLGTSDTDGTWRLVFAPIGTALKSSSPNIDSVVAATKRYVHSKHILWVNNGDVKALGANVLFAVPFELDTEMVVARCAFTVTTLGASSKTRVGLYACSPNGTPGSLLLETADIDTTTVGVKEALFTASKRLPCGWYFVGIISNVAAVAVQANHTANISGNTPLGLNSTLIPITCRYHSVGAGWTAMPSTFTMPGSSALVALSDYAPRIVLGAG